MSVIQAEETGLAALLTFCSSIKRSHHATVTRGHPQQGGASSILVQAAETFQEVVLRNA